MFEILRTEANYLPSDWSNVYGNWGLNLTKEICNLMFIVVYYVAVTEGPVRDSTFLNLIYVNLTVRGKSLGGKIQ